MAVPYRFMPVRSNRGAIGSGIASGIERGVGNFLDERRRRREDERLERVDEREEFDWFRERGGAPGPAPRMPSGVRGGSQYDFDGAPFLAEVANPDYMEVAGGHVMTPDAIRRRDREKLGPVAMALLRGMAAQDGVNPEDLVNLMEVGVDPERAVPYEQRPEVRTRKRERDEDRLERATARTAAAVQGELDRGEARTEAELDRVAAGSRLERQHEMRMEELRFMYPDGPPGGKKMYPAIEVTEWRQVLESKDFGLGKPLEEMSLEEVRGLLKEDSPLSDAEIAQLLIQLFGLDTG